MSKYSRIIKQKRNKTKKTNIIGLFTIIYYSEYPTSSTHKKRKNTTIKHTN